MTLYEIIEIADENKILTVKDSNGVTLATYDGRNSIPSELNTRSVLLISSGNDEIVITVKAMNTYRVYAEATSYYYIDVEAEDEEEAFSIANETDGGEYTYYSDSPWTLKDVKRIESVEC